MRAAFRRVGREQSQFQLGRLLAVDRSAPRDFYLSAHRVDREQVRVFAADMVSDRAVLGRR